MNLSLFPVYRPMMRARLVNLILPGLFVCCGTSAQEDEVRVPEGTAQWPPCEAVPATFVDHVSHVLADSANMFTGDYPMPVPFTCALLAGLEQAVEDDSVRYHFEHLAQRYWRTDPHYARVERYIERHMDFHLAIAATGHFFADVRIMGVRQLFKYRRRRPQVCATRAHYAKLEEQDRQAVRYLLGVVENTPLHISGSENATVHQVYMGEVMRTLDLFTGQEHHYDPDNLLRVNVSEAGLDQAKADWRAWLEK